MKKGIALLVAAGMLIGMAMPVSAAEQITTYKGDQELVLTEAGDTDLTKEELFEKTRTAMEGVEDLALYMVMDIEANISYEAEGTEMSLDLVMDADMSDTKNAGLEYKSEKMNMSFFGMEMKEETEEYIFPNADGKKVSVKKETSSETEGEEPAGWVAEAVEDDADEAAEEVAGEMEDLEETSSIDSFVNDDMYQAFELLDKKYTDGEKEYYVLRAKTQDVMGNVFGDVEEMFGEIESDTDCYMIFSDEGMLESLHMDLGDLSGKVIEQDGAKTTFSQFMIAVYTEEPGEIVIPEEVQAAGDAAV